jgi:ankyrin repeat protein
VARILIIAAPLMLAVLVSVLACSGRPTEDQKATVNVAESGEIVAAIEAGDEKQVKKLASGGWPVNVLTPNGSALDLAAAKGLDTAVVALLKAGADPDIGHPEGGDSPLHSYAETGNVKMLRTLVAAGGDLEYARADGKTPLAVAVTRGHLSASKALIKAGADVNTVFAGQSLLMHVVATNSLLMTQLLIDAGATVNFRNGNGDSALSIAQTSNLQDVQMLLLQSGAE